MKSIRLIEKIFILFTAILYGESLFAQEFGTYWITCPNPDDSSEVWFRKTFVTIHRPRNAKITIATTGRFQLFVNERNVSCEVLLPKGSYQDNSIHEMTFDISNILRNDSNVIAVWYAPNPYLHTDKQLSLAYYGTSQYGKTFYHKADENWLCKKACGYVTVNQEHIDNNFYNPLWKTCTVNTKGWIHPENSTDSHIYPIFDDIYDHQGERIIKVLYPHEIFSDSHSITYRFPRRFRGWVRLTLRNAHHGEIIHINGFSYICNGLIDEQACRRFTIDTQQDLVIEGDRFFRKDQIQNIEGLIIQPDCSWGFGKN
jgi:hypothetical protein